MITRKTQEFLEFRKIVQKVASAIGTWPIENPSLTYRYLPYIPATFTFIMIFHVLGFIRIHTDNIGIMTKGISIMISFLTSTMKIVFWLIYREEIMKVHKSLNQEISEFPKQPDLLHFKLKQVSAFRRLTYLSILFAMFTVISWIMVPLIANLRLYYRHIGPVQYALIFPTIYPWIPPSDGIMLKIHFIYESIAAMSLLVIALGVDSLFLFYISLIVIQLREISYNIMHAEGDIDCKKKMQQYISKYCLLTRCRNNLQKTYGPLVLWLMGSNAVSLCTLAFQVTQMKTISPATIFNLSMFISIKLTQAYSYAWSGAVLVAESEKCKDAIYSAKWYGNKNFMKFVSISLLQRPLSLSACRIIDVSLNIFIVVVKTSISYFLFLQTIETKRLSL